MKRKNILCFCFCLFVFLQIAVNAENRNEKIKDFIDKNISLVENNCFKIYYNNLMIVTDPYRIMSGREKADIVIISHPHEDHLGLASLKKILTSETIILATKDTIEEKNLIKLFGVKIVEVKPGDVQTIKGIKITITHAYDLVRKDHPIDKNWVGFIMELGDMVLYFSGDTDPLPSMQNIKSDIAFLNVGGGFVMSPKEAYEAYKMLNPVVAIPMHYGSVVGTKKDALEFKKLVGEDKVIIIKSENSLHGN